MPRQLKKKKHKPIAQWPGGIYINIFSILIENWLFKIFWKLVKILTSIQ